MCSSGNILTRRGSGGSTDQRSKLISRLPLAYAKPARLPWHELMSRTPHRQVHQGIIITKYSKDYRDGYYLLSVALYKGKDLL